MYLKLNFTNNVPWKDIFNILTIAFSSNAQNISELSTLINVASISVQAKSTISGGYLDVANSEFYKTVSPGVGYGSTNVPWCYSWTSAGTAGNVSSPEITITRNVSYYNNADNKGRYFVKFKYDNYSGATAKTDGTTNAGSTTVTFATPAYGVLPGMIVSGSEITAGTYVTSVSIDAKTITLSAVATGSRNNTAQIYFSNNNFVLGTYKTISVEMDPDKLVSDYSYGIPNKTTILSGGEDRIIGYGMASATSFFLYMTPTCILVGGRGPIGSNSISQGWCITPTRRIANQTISATSGTANILGNSDLIPDGSRISFTTASNASASQTLTGVDPVITAGTKLPDAGYFYARSSASVARQVNFFSSLYNMHAGTAITTAATAGTNDIIVDGLLPHNPYCYGVTPYSTSRETHFGPAFISEFKPYDNLAKVNNDYMPIMYTGGYVNHFVCTNAISAFSLSPKSWYGISSQDFLFADAFHVRESYRLLQIRQPTPKLDGSYATLQQVPVYIGVDLRTIERAPLGDSILNTTDTTRTLSPAISDQPGIKFPNASGNPSFGLFPLTWSNSRYNTAGGKLTPEVAGFFLFNGDYNLPDDYFTYDGKTYSIWPLADGHSRRLGLAVPKT